jgi:futalosine hydrolase
VEALPLRLLLRGDILPLRVAGKDWVLGSLGPPGHELPVAMVVSGFDKTNAAHALTCLLQARRPRLVVQAGVGGGFAQAGAAVGDLLLASEEAYGDTGTSSPDGWLGVESFGLPLVEVGGRRYANVLPFDVGRVEAAARVLRVHPWEGVHPRVVVGRCLTLSQVTGTHAEARALFERWGCVGESMEGAAAAQVCLLHDVPFLEVRGVSNVVGDRDRAAWDIRGAAALAAEAAVALCGRVDEILVASRGAAAPGGPGL